MTAALHPPDGPCPDAGGPLPTFIASSASVAVVRKVRVQFAAATTAAARAATDAAWSALRSAVTFCALGRCSISLM